MKLSLRNKILLPILALIASGMGIATGVSYFQAKAKVENELQKQLHRITDGSVNTLSSCRQADPVGAYPGR